MHPENHVTDDDHHVVQVFYATDRLPLDAEAVSSWKLFTTYFGFPVFLYLAAVGLVVAAFRSKRTVRYGILALLMGGIALKSSHSASLSAQRHVRAMEYGSREYGADRHEVEGQPVLEMGYCEVSVPPDHRVGKVESPSILKLEFREDPAKHVILQRTIHQPEEEVLRELKACLARSAGGEALVFIHGYNVGFDQAVKRTAQIAYDLDFQGAPICYSWPSQGGFEKYTYDEASISWTVPQLEGFLNRLVEKSGARTIHLVAHSMGNRALVEVLERIYLQDKQQHYKFGQIILAAPDVDSSTFRNRYVPVLQKMSARATLYASSNDRALKASTSIHGYTRAGLSGEHLLALAGVETVDASPIDTSLIGHSYYGNNPIMIRDLQALIHEGVPASARTWLQEILQKPDVFYWRFREKQPDEDGTKSDLER
jgi:esterase/lipase superfamily enzyme